MCEDVKSVRRICARDLGCWHRLQIAVKLITKNRVGDHKKLASLVLARITLQNHAYVTQCVSCARRT